MNLLETTFRNVVVVGASAGGIEALVTLVKGIPDDLHIAIFIVQHLPANNYSNLDVVLQPHTGMTVRKARDGEVIKPGIIYLAPADRHLLVERDRVGVAMGPPENRFRPAVDALFRSASFTYRERVIGVVLSGALSDGAAGMWSVKRNGGIAVVQDPAEARFPDMPKAVMRYTSVDYVISTSEIGTLLSRLSREKITPVTGPPKANSPAPAQGVGESSAAPTGTGSSTSSPSDDNKGGSVPLTCPECHHALQQRGPRRQLEFDCASGHVFTAEALLNLTRDQTERAIGEISRWLEETRFLLSRMAEQLDGTETEAVVKRYRRRAQDIQEQLGRTRRVVAGEQAGETGDEDGYDIS
ncbi:chemotaxis protein CheB [Neolewinella litorea]|uniref:protein-glutamate methylesterase n=1 Tax=Neolewinella litorea TaxID=2562452 RepID=A0A4S4NPR8_9BACT|nr:chemotaxis protein CheB [Neolewinella litorea]THH42054.1 chemotaxis protein CheB [Neolewinella litorea]